MEYTIANRFEEVFDLAKLVLKVQQVGGESGCDVAVRNPEDHRLEAEEHCHNHDHRRLSDPGNQSTHEMVEDLRMMLRDMMRRCAHIDTERDVLMPNVRWNGRRAKARSLELAGVGNGE